MGNTITVPFGTLTPGETYTLTITTVVNSLGAPPGGTNTATVTTTSAESDPGNNASAALTTIVSATGFGAPATGFAPDRVTRMPAQPENKRYSDLGDLWIEIPALGLKLPIVGVPITEEGWDVTWLGRQAGWLNGTAFPTWEGNSVLTAHVTLASGRAGPFRTLKNLRWDDSIVIHYAGQRYVYSVRRSATAVMLAAAEAAILDAANIQLSEDDNVLIQGVLGSPYSVGYFGYAYYKENAGSLKALSVDGIAPTEDAAESGEYPIARPLFIYSDASIMTEKPQVAAFIYFYITNVTDEILDVGYFPVSKSKFQENLEAWRVATGQ